MRSMDFDTRQGEMFKKTDMRYPPEFCVEIHLRFQEALPL